jgi:HPt (histidine-containing phosphotransfer) domain-containing protein
MAGPPPNRTLAHLAAHLSEDDTRELVRIFLAEFPALHASLGKADVREAFVAAHSLKSSAQQMGLADLARRMAEMEAELAEGGGPVAPEALDAVRQEFERESAPLRAFADC